MPGPGATAAVAEFAIQSSIPSLAPADLDAARRSLLDTACAASAGTTSQAGRKVLALLERSHRSDQSRVLGTGLRCPAPWAALGTAVLAHSQEADDAACFGAAGAPVWAALLALAEAEQCRDERLLLESFCAGVHAAASLFAAGRYSQSSRGFDGTAVFGAIAATAASARLIGLPAAQTMDAIAIAASEAGGVGANLGTETAALHAGFAARNGVQAVCLARLGCYGAHDILEARQGFGEAFFGPAMSALRDIEAWLAEPPRIADRVRIKRFPCHLDHQRPVSALCDLIAEHSLSFNDIAAVEVTGVPPTSEGVRFDVPADPVQAKGSLRYVSACAALDGTVSLAHMGEQRVRDPRVTAAMARCTVGILPRWDARLLDDYREAQAVRVVTSSGGLLEAEPGAVPPSLTAAAIRVKWREATDCLPAGVAKDIRRLCDITERTGGALSAADLCPEPT
jgi:2-methylcitrate dehydratase PrpD